MALFSVSLYVVHYMKTSYLNGRVQRAPNFFWLIPIQEIIKRPTAPSGLRSDIHK